MADHTLAIELPITEKTEDEEAEIQDWILSLEDVVHRDGLARAEYLVDRLIEAGRRAGGRFHTRHTTPYRNTISVDAQPPYPGNLDLEQRITAIHRWNALALVMRANQSFPELGGHIATYASIADLFEVGFHHFFRGATQDHPGDLVYFQPHSAPGVYARAYLEGRLKEENLDLFRREVSSGIGRGLSSYPHPTLMPTFWQFPTGSMGLGLISAIYQARFQRYLQHRGIMPSSDRKVWSFVGDGEMDEPESLAGISLAAREQLDNLVLVVNCNLQRLDGPVRGNGNIVQELETLFAGAGWNVIKCLWGSNWDVLFARDRDGWILRRMAEAVDGEFQKLSTTDGHYNREHFFSRYPQLAALVANMSDTDIDALQRGGHDPVKIHAAYAAAIAGRGQPTVILAKTTKGYGMGGSGQGANTSHQIKKLAMEDLVRFRDRFGLSLSDDDLKSARFHHPGDDSVEVRYLKQRREQLGGFLPRRIPRPRPIAVPGADFYAGAHGAVAGGREISTTMSFVRLLGKLLRDKVLGPRIVPIVADEARTFGMQDMFRQYGIYSPWGQRYTPQDSDQLAFYREDVQGQILEEGITEAGALSSWIAAGTAWSHSDQPMLPFYIFYSMFGFQRVADLIWYAADSQARGFLLGATAGRTTLSGEGLQHQDGQSQVYAATVPTCRSYDPAFGYEVAVIIEDGIRRMMTEGENIFFYLTLYNENYPHPAMPEGAEEGIRRGIYLLRTSALDASRPRVQLIGSGSILCQALFAAERLETEFNVAADVWSATSFGELRRDGLACNRWNLLHPGQPPRIPYMSAQMSATHGPVIAASDFIRAYPDMIREWVPRRYTVLGTDGFGRSDTRADLRDFFEVDARYIVLAALGSLADEGGIEAGLLEQAMKSLAIDPDKPSPLES